MLRAAAGSKPRRCGWPSLVARFKVIFDEADRIQSELGIRFCRPQVRCLPPTFQLNRARYYSIIHAPRTPGSGKAKGGGGRLAGWRNHVTSLPGAGKAGQDPRACVVAVESGFAARGPGQRHPPAASCGGNTSGAARRRVVAFPAPNLPFEFDVFHFPTAEAGAAPTQVNCTSSISKIVLIFYIFK